LLFADSIGAAEIFLDAQYSELSSMNKPGGATSEMIQLTTLDVFAKITNLIMSTFLKK